MKSYYAYDVKGKAEYKFGYEFILDGIIERIKNQLKEFDVVYEKNDINQIYEFLSGRVDGKVWISFVGELPNFKDYDYMDLELKVHTIHLAFGINTVESRFPYALYVSITTDYGKKFRIFWEKNYFPTCLYEESVLNLDVTKPIIVHVFETLYHWRGALAAAKNPVIIGQDINSENFKPFRPVGFVDGSYLVITSPNERSDPLGRVVKYN